MQLSQDNQVQQGKEQKSGLEYLQTGRSDSGSNACKNVPTKLGY